jgi:Protein of unknown function (DUF4232)
MLKALLVPVLLGSVALAGCGGGAQEAGPVPTAKGSTDTAPAVETTSTATGDTGASGSSSTPSTPRCSPDNMTVEVDYGQGAAGTIMTVWRARNTSSSSCRSYGYPGMDFHSGRWLDVHVHRGGYPAINVPPSSIVVASGQSLYFVSYWGDVDTQAGPCKEFDRVKVTLPDNFSSSEIATRGCVDTDLVRVGPVSAAPPA